MPKPIIEVKNVSKKYRIGVSQPYYTFRDSLVGLAKHPLRLFKQKKIQSGGLFEDEFWALRDVSFNVMPGETLGIVGRNGAGKSTLLKILSRITSPTRGEIILRGRVASLLEIGTGFHPELTGRENIFLNGAILGMKRREIKKKFDEIVDFAEIEKFLDTPVKHFSSGMYMRLAFAVAAHLDSDILLVDEVLSVGDAVFQKKCLGKMKDVEEEGRAIIFISHNMESVLHLCQKGLCLHKGKIIKSGSQKDTVEYYMSRFTPKRFRKLDLRKIKRPTYIMPSQFRVSYFNIQGGSNNLTFRIGEKIIFEIRYEYEHKIDGLKINLGINSQMNQRLCTFSSPPKLELCNTHRIFLEVNTSNLKAGLYNLDIDVSSGNITFDDLKSISTFEILPIFIDESPDVSGDYGLFTVSHNFHT